MSVKRKIAVIGTGWSGLSAAVNLAGKADVTVFEAGKTAGGRARALAADNAGFSFLDNGQHIMMYAYRGVRHLMDKIGADYRHDCVRLPLQWHLADGLQFQTASLPAPLHLLWGVLGAKNVRWSDKAALLKQMRNLRIWHGEDVPVGKWLRSQQCPQKLLAGFWRPLVLGALNTPIEDASLRVLRAVLQDGVWADKRAADYLLPKTDLNTLLVEPAIRFLRQHGARLYFERRVGRLALLPGGRVAVNGEPFDAVVAAVAPYHISALMPSETPEDIQTAFEGIRYHAITTVYLRYAETVRLPSVMTGLAGGTVQWFFQRGCLGASDREVAAVISVSEHVGRLSAEEWIRRADADLHRICPEIGTPIAAKVITEKRATAASYANRPLPDCRWLQQNGIYPAGDYLHPRYPATLEAAVQSGLAAAELVLCEHGCSGY